MALIKETGAIVAGANSYAEASDADTFQTNRGRAAWCDSGADVKDAALIRATDYIESRFGLSFIGDRIGDVQLLSWPRTGARYPATGNDFPIDEVPVDVVNACILYAEQVIGPGDDVAAMTELAITPEVDESGGTVTRLKEKVDVLETDTTFAGNDSGSTSLRLIRPIPEADRLIRRWFQLGRVGLTVRI